MKTETITKIINTVISRSSDKYFITGLRRLRTDSMELVYRNIGDEYISNKDVEFLVDVIKITSELVFRGLTVREGYTNIGTVMGKCVFNCGLSSNSVKNDINILDKNYTASYVVKKIVDKYIRLSISNKIKINVVSFFTNIYNISNEKFHFDNMGYIVKEYVRNTK